MRRRQKSVPPNCPLSTAVREVRKHVVAWLPGACKTPSRDVSKCVVPGPGLGVCPSEGETRSNCVGRANFAKALLVAELHEQASPEYAASNRTSRRHVA